MFCFLETSFLIQEQALEQVQQNLSNCSNVSSTPQLSSIASMSQFPSVSQLGDVQPTDWAFEALQSLINGLEGVSGYSQEIFRGNNSLTRYEFAVGFYEVLQHLDQAKNANLSKADWETVERLKKDFAAELAMLNNRITKLDTQITKLEDQQFSPTTKLSGQIILSLNDDFGESTDSSLNFQYRAKLNFNSSFTGKDRLNIGLSNGNFEEFSFVRKITNEGRLGFKSNTRNRVRYGSFSYRFPIGKNIRAFIGATGNDVNPINPILSNTAKGAISRFGSQNPIHRLVKSGGFGLKYKLNNDIKLGLGYYAGELKNSSPGNGLFNGDYSATVQLELKPIDDLTLGLLYVHSYNDSNLSTGTGSLRSQINLNRPVVANSYSLEASWKVDSNFAISGWVGFSDATVLNLGEADVLNYAITFAFEDLIQEGDLLGFIIGQEPRLIETSGFTIDGRTSDPDISLHLEALYRYQLTEQIAITPGLIWITAPNHDKDNSDIVVLAIRTTFTF